MGKNIIPWEASKLEYTQQQFCNVSIQIFLRRTNRTLNFNGCFLSYQSYLSAAQIASCILKLYLRKPLSCFISWTMEWISCLVLCCGSLRVISLAHLGIRNWKHKRNCILITDKKSPTTFRTFPLWTDKIVGSSINCRFAGVSTPYENYNIIFDDL